jgi:hypothetical protein
MIFSFSCFYFFLMFGLGVVWGKPFPWSSMTGVESGDRKSGRPGKLFGGTFGGNCLENAEGKMTNV